MASHIACLLPKMSPEQVQEWWFENLFRGQQKRSLIDQKNKLIFLKNLTLRLTNTLSVNVSTATKSSTNPKLYSKPLDSKKPPKQAELAIFNSHR